MAKMIDMKEEDIIKAGGVFLRQETNYSDQYGGWITDHIYILNGEEVYSNTDWIFEGR